MAHVDAVKELIMEAFKSAPRGAQTRIADALAVRPQTVNKWAKGQVAPDPDRWPALEDQLGLDRGAIAAAAGVVFISHARRREDARESGFEIAESLDAEKLDRLAILIDTVVAELEGLRRDVRRLDAAVVQLAAQPSTQPEPPATGPAPSSSRSRRPSTRAER